jgi:hypothetical protein
VQEDWWRVVGMCLWVVSKCRGRNVGFFFIFCVPRLFFSGFSVIESSVQAFTHPFTLPTPGQCTHVAGGSNMAGASSAELLAEGLLSGGRAVALMPGIEVDGASSALLRGLGSGNGGFVGGEGLFD